ncbi:chromosome transmission fidelity protein 8 [Neohortaea acidophila]|uniref:Chromosome transmission fidelity protein 8 n=1 Tax=Neohortaea acidophila TaxID=245834 RepID=A0A6A6PGE1_9PEZI|nr:chromosome transmission fidelity protein 8 [Neohortaea acidophila]KAF2479039.1 chromosome transmission fidelity protein 8 [Neohortaea acidophila]
MPTIPIYPQSRQGATHHSNLPHVLQTPSGLAVVEIQGTIKCSTPHTGAHDDVLAAVGRVVFPYYDDAKGAGDNAWQKRVYLYIGQHQRLTGEVKKLANPMALLRRRAASNDGHDELEIAEIVHYKLTFAHRPEPVGANGGE